MSGARDRARTSAARATAAAHDTGCPAIDAAGGASAPCARNHGSARPQARSARTMRSPSIVICKSSHTQPHCVQATSSMMRSNGEPIGREPPAATAVCERAGLDSTVIPLCRRDKFVQCDSAWASRSLRAMPRDRRNARAQVGTAHPAARMRASGPCVTGVEFLQSDGMAGVSSGAGGLSRIEYG